MIRKLIFSLGLQYRNNLINPAFSFLCKSQYWDREKLLSYQLDKLKELLCWAYEKSEFHKYRMDQAKVDPHSISDLKELAKLPVMSKQDLLSNLSGIQNTQGFDKLFFSETSGSTGEPLTFYKDKVWDARTRAAIFRGYSWYNVQPWEPNGYFWGYNIAQKKALKIKILDYLQNRFRIFSYQESEISKFAPKLKKAAFLEGYSSMIYEVAKIINKSESSSNLGLKLVKGTSEKIFTKYQAESIRAFGRKITSEYGSAETGIIAFECPNENMEIFMVNVIVEEINNEIVVTNLMSKSLPIIRYKLGDYVELDTFSKCPCGMSHPIVKDILGRTGHLIIGKKNNYPSLTLYYVFKNIAVEEDIILNYQAIQITHGKLTINIEQQLSKREEDLIIHETNKYFKNDIEISLQDGQQIKRTNGKLKDFISHIEQ